MIISEKQILELMNQCRRYQDVCRQMDWNDHWIECQLLLKLITDQQSKELQVIE